MQLYVKAIYAALVAGLGSISTALLAVDGAGFGDLGTGVYVASGLLAVLAFGGILGWQALPASVSTSVR